MKINHTSLPEIKIYQELKSPPDQKNQQEDPENQVQDKQDKDKSRSVMANYLDSKVDPQVVIKRKKTKNGKFTVLQEESDQLKAKMERALNNKNSNTTDIVSKSTVLNKLQYEHV